jgi:hypothetical protein
MKEKNYQSNLYHDLSYWFFLICQEHLFRALVFLCRNANSDVQSATREALLRIDVSFLLLVIFLSNMSYLN